MALGQSALALSRRDICCRLKALGGFDIIRKETTADQQRIANESQASGMALNSAIDQLDSLSDPELFAAVGEGMKLLETNIQRLHDAATNLSDIGDHASATILGGLATEEAAKILILLDAVRCPGEKRENRKRTLLRWKNHLWKGIYAEACNGKLFHQSFDQLAKFVKNESALFYLDGPADYEWIFPNAIKVEREQRMYVDYVGDITNGPNEQPWWSAPYESESKYEPSSCLRVVSALSIAGVTTVSGLEVVAKVWRNFEPHHQTSTSELDSCISSMLDNLEERQISEGSITLGHLANHLVQWPFPLWSVSDSNQSERKQLTEIRQEREARLEEVRRCEANREPQLTISEEKVRQLQEVFDIYAEDLRRQQARYSRTTQRGLAIIPAGIPDYDEDAVPYANLKRLWRNLSDAERHSLIALSLFTRGEVADWSYAHHRALWIADNNDERYQVHLGGRWLKGLLRYQADPPDRK